MTASFDSRWIPSRMTPDKTDREIKTLVERAKIGALLDLIEFLFGIQAAAQN